MAHNDLDTFPDSVVRLSNVKICDVSFNALRELPDKARRARVRARGRRGTHEYRTRRHGRVDWVMDEARAALRALQPTAGPAEHNRELEAP